MTVRIAALLYDMSTNTQPRQPSGTPTGGQFSGKSNPESEVALDAEQSVMTVSPHGTESWHLNGVLHRIDGPAMTHRDGSEEWWKNGQLHRAEGPAVTANTGLEVWYRSGQLHRAEGPTVSQPDSCYEEWYLHGERHRENGPAITHPNGSQEWWENGERIR